MLEQIGILPPSQTYALKEVITLPLHFKPELPKMPGSFSNRVAIITGASSGIGWALAQVLGSQGARLGLIARRADKLEALVQIIKDKGGSVAAVSADVADHSKILQAVHELRDRLGPVDLLVANAGVGMPTLLQTHNVADIERMIQVNYLGVVYCIEAVLPEMLLRSQGHLAAISSLAAYKGLPGESGYCASKAAVSTYMEGLRIHLRGRGIAVTTICPGFVRTPMTEVNPFKMPWLLEADVAAQRIARALARRRKVYNFPWQTTLLTKLTRWLPDWAMARTMQEYNENPPIPPVSG